MIDLVTLYRGEEVFIRKSEDQAKVQDREDPGKWIFT